MATLNIHSAGGWLSEATLHPAGSHSEDTLTTNMMSFSPQYPAPGTRASSSLRSSVSGERAHRAGYQSLTSQHGVARVRCPKKSSVHVMCPATAAPKSQPGQGQHSSKLYSVTALSVVKQGRETCPAQRVTVSSGHHGHL